MAAFEVPLQSIPESFAIQLGSQTYQLTLWWNDAEQGGWMLDIADSLGNSLVTGIPLVTGEDLLAQYTDLGFDGKLIVQSDTVPGAVPTYTNLGSTSHLYFVTS